MQSGPAHDLGRKHLFFILTNVCPAPPDGAGHVLCVSVSSIKSGEPYDKTCELSPADHSFIRHPTFVSYRDAHIKNASRLVANSHAIVIKELLAEEVFRRVCDGLMTSPHASPKTRRFYEKSLNRLTDS